MLCVTFIKRYTFCAYPVMYLDWGQYPWPSTRLLSIKQLSRCYVLSSKVRYGMCANGLYQNFSCNVHLTISMISTTDTEEVNQHWVKAEFILYTAIAITSIEPSKEAFKFMGL